MKENIREILLMVWLGITVLLVVYLPFAGLLKINFGIPYFNAFGIVIVAGSLILWLTVTNHLDWNLKKQKKKDEMSEEEKSIVSRLERNPDLFNKITVELRKRKIDKIKTST